MKDCNLNWRKQIEFLSEHLKFNAKADDAFAQLQLQMMGAFAEFERNIIRKRHALLTVAVNEYHYFFGGAAYRTNIKEVYRVSSWRCMIA